MNVYRLRVRKLPAAMAQPVAVSTKLAAVSMVTLGTMVSAKNNAHLLTSTLVPEQMNRRPAQPVVVSTKLAAVLMVTLGIMVSV